MRPAFAVCYAILALNVAARAADWPGIFSPNVFNQFHFRMLMEDFEAIQADESLADYRPAEFWEVSDQGSTEPILVPIRRKSADPLGSGTYRKVSYKARHIALDAQQHIFANANPSEA
jgi:hypothetical protein